MAMTDNTGKQHKGGHIWLGSWFQISQSYGNLPSISQLKKKIKRGGGWHL